MFFYSCRSIGRSFLSLLALICFFYQIFCVYYLFDLYQLLSTYFYLFKGIYVFFYTMMLISFFRTSYTDPGSITEENNKKFFVFYMIIRKMALTRGQRYNERMKKNIHPPNTENDFEEETDCEEDEMTFIKKDNQDTLFTQCKELCPYLRRCPKCFITRVPNVHHCPDCHKCIYMLDHHCVWLNTCIGQFNQKFFILFLLYLMLSSILSIILTVMYIIIPLGLELMAKGVGMTVMTVYLIIIDAIMTLLSGKLLYDQYDNLKDNAMVYDFKLNCMAELRTKKEVLCEIMGGAFSYEWFFPIKKGGYYSFWESSIESMEKKNL